MAALYSGKHRGVVIAFLTLGSGVGAFWIAEGIFSRLDHFVPTPRRWSQTIVAAFVLGYVLGCRTHFLDDWVSSIEMRF